MKSYPSLTVLRTRTCPAVSLLPRFTFFDGSGPDVEVVDADVVVEDDVDAEVVVFSLPGMENICLCVYCILFRSHKGRLKSPF